MVCRAYAKITDMTGEKSDKKRPAVKARKLSGQQAKGVRRKQRTGNGPHSDDSRSYGMRSVGRSHTGVSITVQIPPLRRPKQVNGLSKSSKSRRFLVPAFATLLLITTGGAGILRYADSPSEKVDVKPVAATQTRTEPDYELLVPSAEQASSTKYDRDRNLVSYTTTFSGIRITVSQQRLPDTFTRDKEALAKAADSVKAEQKIDTSKGPLYVATQEEGSEQLAVYAGKGVLVFIHAASKLDPLSWKAFVEQMQSKSWDELG